jgi:DNA-binding transcriptional LysR family regulator
VTAAARELNYAQPSISHHLARLEAETGTKLIQRAGRGVRLTEAGRLLADRAAEVLGRLDAAENELAAHAGLRRGRVRLAAFPSALGTIVPVAVARLQAEHPGLEIMLTEAEPPEALRMLRAGYVDVALVFRHEPGPDPEASRARLLLDEPVFLVTPASRPAAEPAEPRTGTAPAGGARPLPVSGPPGQAAVAPEGLTQAAVAPGPAPGLSGASAIGGTDLAVYARERWIAGCERCRSYLLEQCARAGFTPKIAFTTDDYVAVQALVAAGLGVTTLPGLALRAARNRGVRAAPLAGARRYIFAVTYGAPPDPPPTARLLDTLTAAASSGLAAAEPGVQNPATREPSVQEFTGAEHATVPVGTVSGAARGTTSP